MSKEYKAGDRAFTKVGRNLVEERIESDPASHLIELLGLDKPVYADTCARGLFGYETL